MSKVAIVYWSGTGNTEAMANAVAEGLKEVGSEVELYTAGEFDASKITEFDAVAFGCPAMGAEVLEEDEFEPFFTEIESKLSGKKFFLFGSYGWGDGEWMRNWQERVTAAGAELIGDEGYTVNEAPSDDDLAKLKAIGAELV